MKRILLFFYLVLCMFVAQSQTPQSSRIVVKGALIDTSGTPLPSATVMLLLPKDSSLVNFGRSNDKGFFEFKNVKRQRYILKVSYVSYIPLQKDVIPTDEAVLDMGSLALKPITKELFEVVVKTAKAPLSIKGDTIEYNAASFKVPPGSTVEDLLRKLPGMQIEQDGSIRAQGMEVKKVTVDGKSFFGSDPKQATKNISADAIQKVQVFNDKTEAAKMTGVDDGKKEKTINLELKESHKKGGFGKVTAGIGTDDRREIKGNYNKFDSKNQFSVVGNANNTNQSGLSWDDYQDFRGSQAFSWGDEADFGFGGNGFRFITFDDGDESLGIPIGGSRDGFSKNYSGGANYNYDTKKTKFSSNYYFNQTERTIDKISSSQRFFQEKSLNSADTTNQVNFNANHRMSLRFEKTLDTLNTLVLIGNGKYSRGNASQFSNILQQLLVQNSIIPRQTNINNSNIFDSYTFQGTGIFRHKFAKKGRSFSASAGYSLLKSDGNANQRSINKLYNATTLNDSIVAIDQINDNLSNKKQVKSSLFFVEPLSKIFYWESFYNFSIQNNSVNRDLLDRQDTGPVRNDSLSRYYTNDLMYNRLGSSIRYSNKGMNITVGLAAQQFNLKGDFRRSENSANLANINLNYFTWIPKIGINWDLKNNRYLFIDYDKNTREPSVRDLQPIVDNSNPLYLRVGNPDLLPSIQHTISAGYNMFNPASFTNLYANLSYNYNINQVVYNQTIGDNGVVLTKPTNLSGGTTYNGYVGFGVPLKKTVSTLNINANFNLAQNPIYINSVLNKTNTNSGSIGMRLSFTPSDKFTFYGNASLGLTKTSYELPTAPNQTIYNNQYGGEMNFNFGKEFYFASNLNYRVYKNETRGFTQDLPILNLALYKFLGKSKRSEIRLTAYDVFKKNLGVNQSAFQNFVTIDQTRTLSRYFMLSYTYNMRGLSSQMRKKNMF